MMSNEENRTQLPQRRKRFFTGTVVLLLVLAVALTFVGTVLLLMPENNKRLVTEEEYAAIERYSRLDSVYNMLMENYYVEPDGESLLDGAVKGMVAALKDPYSLYYTPEEMAEETERDDGTYHGIGIYVMRNDELLPEIARVYPGSFAEAAGLLAGDVIIAVDGTRIENGENSVNEASNLIEGPDGSTVPVTVRRDGSEVTLVCTRGPINIDYADSTVLDNGIGYLHIEQFTGNDVEIVKESIAMFKKAGVRGVVLDLRGNPGGYLDHVLPIAEEFLPGGLVSYMEDRQGNREDYTLDSKYWDIPMVLLVNQYSASASELFTAAFKDDARGTIVGVKTFGKGIVQNVYTFKDGAGLSFTTQSYYSPKGNAIHQVGVTPDVEVEWDKVYDSTISGPDVQKDNQLAVALTELEKQIAGH